MGGAPSTYGERRRAYKVSMGKTEGRTPLGRPRRRWEDNIKMNFQKVEWVHGLDCSASE